MCLQSFRKTLRLVTSQRVNLSYPNPAILSLACPTLLQLAYNLNAMSDGDLDESFGQLNDEQGPDHY
jgi:hypothetical protein